MSVSKYDIIFTLPVEPRAVDFFELFGNDRPVELEIGTGKGGFLLEQARSHEDRNYLGIEWANKYFKYASDRMARWGVKNVRIIRCDAKIFVQRCLGEASLCAMHIYHPDPWPKKRHHKRRLFDSTFVEAVVRVLSDGATLSVQTDYEDYFRIIYDLLSQRTELEETPDVRHNGCDGDDIIATNYSRKYQKERLEIWRLLYTRKPRS